jgi:hypothetical protein
VRMAELLPDKGAGAGFQTACRHLLA